MSTRRLVAAAVLLTVTGLALLLWPGSPRSAAGTPASASTSSAAGMSPEEGRGDHGHGVSATSAAQRLVVGAFAVAFTAPGRHDDWLAALQPYVSPGLLEGFTYTDPHRRPGGRVQQVTHLHPGDLFKVTYRGGESVVCAVDRADGGGWVITSATPVRASAPTGHDLGSAGSS